MENELVSENFNSLLVLPSLISTFFILVAISIKRGRVLLCKNRLITGLTLSLLLLNILELLTFGNFLNNYDVLLRLYYCGAVTAASIFFCLGERLHTTPIIPRRTFQLIMFSLTSLLLFYILFTNHIVAGALRSSYTISRIPGEFYWTNILFIVICVICAPILIFLSIKHADNPLDKKRHIVILISFIPIILSVLIILFMMKIGIQINLSIFLPLSTLIFIIVYLFTENKNDLFRFLVNIPFSQERAAYKQINNQVIEYISKSQTDEKQSLKQIMAEIEKTFITNALEIKEGNHNLAAELLSTSISTIYRNKERRDTV